MAWLSGWSYRKSHEIEGSTAGAVTDYQVRIKAHYGSGADSGEDVYLNEKCRSDFGDVRFTADDGETLLAYWMEEKVDSDYAVFWVKVPSIPADPDKATIYVYYGKSDATYAGDGDETFLFFDEFATLDTAKWPTRSGSVSVTDGALKVERSSGVDAKAISKELAGYTSVIVRARILHNYVGNDNYWLLRDTSGAKENVLYITHDDDTSIYYIGATCEDTGIDVTEGEYHIYDRKFISAGEEYLMVDESGTWVNVTRTEGGQAQNVGYIVFTARGVNGNYLQIDYIFIRKYADPEPSHGDWGAEEGLCPSVSTQPASNVTAVSATLNGSVNAINDSEIVERGFEWGTEPGSYPYSWTETGSFGTGSFNHDLSDLQPNTTYYYRAKAKNNNGKWGYGDEVSFTTLSGIPSVSTLDPDVNGKDVIMKGEVTDLNGSPDVSERGFEWGKESGSYPHSWTEAGSFSAEQFSHQETLTPWITYYYRAKAKGVGGWGYGAERSFITYEPGYGMIYFPSSKDLNLDLSWAKWMRLYLYGDHTEDFTIKIRLHQDAENYFEGSLVVKAGEWRKYEISMATLSRVGSPNLSNINYIAIVSPHILLIDSDFVFLSAVRELMRVKFTLRRDSPDDPSPKIKLVRIIWREGA